MKWYEISLNLNGPIGTRMLADTFFGHLIWALRDLKGEAIAQEWISQTLVGNPPVLLSDALPQNFFPTPLISPNFTGIDDSTIVKRLKKIKWLPESIFLKLAKNITPETLTSALLETAKSSNEGNDDLASHEGGFVESIRTQVSINRLTDQTDDGKLFSQTIFFAKNGGKNALRILMAVSSTTSIELVKELIKIVGLYGFGKDASTGSGAFTASMKTMETPTVANSNALVSLCHFIPDKSSRVFAYDLFTKFGKVSREGVVNGSPFKKPVIFMTPGSIVEKREQVQGVCLDKVYPNNDKVIQYAYLTGYPAIYNSGSEK